MAAVGAMLVETVRASDFVGRNGGEEFIVLLPDTDPDRAVARFHRSLASLLELIQAWTSGVAWAELKRTSITRLKRGTELPAVGCRDGD